MHPEQQPITGTEYHTGAPSTPRAALAQFYAAFNGSDIELMAENWDHGDDAIMDNPIGGIARGWDSIRPIYERLFGGTARIQVEFFDYTLHEHADLFYAVGRERGALRHDGQELTLAIRTTRVFRRDGDAWRQIHHHGSMDDPDMLKKYQDLVRSK